MSDVADLRLLRRVVDQVPALVAYWDVEGRNVMANHAYVDYFGLDPEQIRGMHIGEVLGADAYEQSRSAIDGALAGREQLFDRTVTDQGGRTHHTQVSYVPDLDGTVVRGFHALVTDVTPRVEAQRAMDEAQAIARLGSWDLEVATGAVTWSRNLYEIVGAQPDSGSPPPVPVRAVQIHPDHRQRVLSYVEDAIANAEPYSRSYVILTADGREREIVSSGRPVVGHDGQVTHIVGMMQDVTEANAAARDLARANAELRLANELNADVIAMLGHDIRNPLTAVQATLEDLEQGWEEFDDAEVRRHVAKARAASQRLGTIIERILALSSIDDGNIRPLPEELDLRTVLADIAEDPGLPGRPVVELDHAVPATIRFDRAHLHQVVGNLLTNAFRYGAEPVGLVVSGGVGQVRIEVSDAGTGVEPAQQASLFTRFAHTGLRQLAVGGTGFGLYMAARLAQANGATLTYRPSDPGRGHAFVLALPGTPAPT